MSEQKVKTFDKVFHDQEDNEVAGTTSQFLGTRGIKLQTKLARLVMPLMSGVKSVKSMDLDTSKMVEHLLTNLTESKVIELIKELMGHTMLDNKDMTKSANFDFMFAGNYQMLFEVLRWVIDVNNFFGKGGIGAMIEKVKERIAQMPLESENLQDS